MKYVCTNMGIKSKIIEVSFNKLNISEKRNIQWMYGKFSAILFGLEGVEGDTFKRAKKNEFHNMDRAVRFSFLVNL